MNKVWQGMSHIQKHEGASNYSPLWGNRNYEELCKLEGFECWHSQGLQYIVQLYSQTVLKSFQDRQKSYQLPRHIFFKYPQIRHTLQAQFKRAEIVIRPMPLLTSLAVVTEKKGLISSLYSQLMTNYQDISTGPGSRGWEKDLGAISDDV